MSLDGGYRTRARYVNRLYCGRLPDGKDSRTCCATRRISLVGRVPSGPKRSRVGSSADLHDGSAKFPRDLGLRPNRGARDRDPRMKPRAVWMFALRSRAKRDPRVDGSRDERVFDLFNWLKWVIVSGRKPRRRAGRTTVPGNVRSMRARKCRSSAIGIF